jgi:predicted RNA-binding Zn-ribbon protein involved in translation (DUF1610 family)
MSLPADTPRKQISRDHLTVSLVINSLRSRTCPACGEQKTIRQTLCRQCYFKLNSSMRYALYATVANGYEEALLEALTYLSCEHFFEEKPL